MPFIDEGAQQMARHAQQLGARRPPASHEASAAADAIEFFTARLPHDFTGRAPLYIYSESRPRSLQKPRRERRR